MVVVSDSGKLLVGRGWMFLRFLRANLAMTYSLLLARLLNCSSSFSLDTDKKNVSLVVVVVVVAINNKKNKTAILVHRGNKVRG